MQPSGPDGIANWTSLGFIRHGPSGNYSITFAYGGLHLEAETEDIIVRSSVATVTLQSSAAPIVVTLNTRAIPAWSQDSISLNAPYGSPVDTSFIPVGNPDFPNSGTMFTSFRGA